MPYFLVNHSPGIRQDTCATRDSGRRKRPAAAWTLPAFLWLGFCLPAWANDVLSDLPPAQQNLINLNCTSLQFTEGAEAYRECLQNELAAAEISVELDSGILATLSIDEQYAIQRACTDLDSTDYAFCAREQLSQMSEQPEPQLATVPEDEQYVLAQQCFDIQTNAGARAYRECLNTALTSLQTLPAANYSPRSAAERAGLQLECSITSNNVLSYRQCILEALGIAFEKPEISIPAPVTATQAEPDAVASVDTQESQSTEQAVTNDQPLTDSLQPEPVAVAVQEVPETRPAAETGSIPENMQLEPETSPEPIRSGPEALQPAAPPTPAALPTIGTSQTEQGFLSLASDFISGAKNSLGTLSPAYWIALFAALSIPLMFFIDRSPRRASLNRAVDEMFAEDEEPPQPVRRNRGEPRSAPGKPDLAPASNNRPLQSRDNRQAVRREASIADEADLATPETAQRSQQGEPVPARASTTRRANGRAIRFVDWLKNFEADEQQEFAIEFLVYWMAYADNRYDPALKQQVFQMQNPDAHTLIKRWVFKKDANAFADAIGFLQSNTSAIQRQQILDLLMALLVTEKALTPVQNNLLRFLADVFGICKAGIHAQFITAYGEKMPQIPRPDKTIWWGQLTADQKLRWDARAVARQPDQIRYRIALGQPLQGELSRESVDRSFKLAIARCHHDRVSELGDRERTLLDAQRKKFETARSALLEPVT